MDFFYYLIKITVLALQIVKELNPSQESDAQVGTYDRHSAVEWRRRFGNSNKAYF